MFTRFSVKFKISGLVKTGRTSIVRSIEFVIRVGAGTEGVGLFESIHLFVYKLILQNAISGVKRRARLCLEQNGEHFQHLL
jgi:hypothetical protein